MAGFLTFYVMILTTFRKAKKVTKKPSKAAAASEATTPELEGLSYVSTGPGQGSGGGVYYVDFSDEYKTCLKRSRDEIEKETHLSMLEKREAKWTDEISKDRNLPIEDRLLQLKVFLQTKIWNYSTTLKSHFSVILFKAF